MQSWKQRHLDMAEHFYGNLESGEAAKDADFVVRVVDLCYEIGAEQLQASQHETAIKWLQRAADFSQPNTDGLNEVDLADMRLNVLQTLGTNPDTPTPLAGD